MTLVVEEGARRCRQATSSKHFDTLLITTMAKAAREARTVEAIAVLLCLETLINDSIQLLFGIWYLVVRGWVEPGTEKVTSASHVLVSARQATFV
jgi:hypothetical protein